MNFTEQDLFIADLEITLTQLKELLISKNKEYGDAALNPEPIFSNLESEERIRARIDEKLHRIKKRVKNKEDILMNDIDDTIGGLLLLKINLLRKQKSYDYLDQPNDNYFPLKLSEIDL